MIWSRCGEMSERLFVDYKNKKMNPYFAYCSVNMEIEHEEKGKDFFEILEILSKKDFFNQRNQI